MIGGGTSNHLILADVFTSFGVGGKLAEEVLNEIGITLNKNTIPFDERKPFDPSGIRFGTPAMTTRGMGETEAARIAEIMVDIMRNTDDEAKKGEYKAEMIAMCEKFPVPEKFV